MKRLMWAVLGTGVIANEMAQAFQNMGRELYGVCNRTYEKAVCFAEKYSVKKVFHSYDEMYQDDAVDIIYITTPHNTHYDFIKNALMSGKHVLAEKSITLNSRELSELVYMAESRSLVLAEAMTIWHMPLYKRLWEIVESGRIGKPQMITINFGSFKEYDMENRFFNMNLAGGAMLDIGVYALSAARSFMERKPSKILSQRKTSPTGSDEQATMLLMNDSEQMATIALSMHSKQPKRAMISCERAYIEVMEYPRADRAVIIDAETGAQEVIEEGNTKMALQYELMDMEQAVIEKNAGIMKLDYTADVMEMMTRIRKEWGMCYPGEEW